MSIFAKSSFPAPARTKDSQTVAVLYAGILVVFIVSQLFSFEEFLALVQSFQLPGGDTLAYVSAALIITVELFALPFLLRMQLSIAFRYVSMLCSWLAAVAWVYISTWLLLSNSQVDTVGFLGTVISVMPGLPALLISLSLCVLAVWSSWGLWPQRYSSTK
jgi:hypothetical protein